MRALKPEKGPAGGIMAGPVVSLPGIPMVQKVSEVVGTSKESFAKAVENAVATTAQSVRNLKWFRATEFEGRIEGQKVTEYHVTVRVYFDYEGT